MLSLLGLLPASRGVRPNVRELPNRCHKRILDNGLVFGAKVFVSVARRYGLEQEYITPYSPEQNGMIERFFLTLKQECVWLQRFEDRDHAFRVVADWLDRYHTERPHSALGYLTPKEYQDELAA